MEDDELFDSDETFWVLRWEDGADSGTWVFEGTITGCQNYIARNKDDPASFETYSKRDFLPSELPSVGLVQRND